MSVFAQDSSTPLPIQTDNVGLWKIRRMKFYKHQRLDGMVDTNTDTNEKEPLDDCSQTVDNIKADDGIRTRGLLITSELLYP
jgi:hypothetical protein